MFAALFLSGFFVARAATWGSPPRAGFPAQTGTGEVFTVPVGTETVVRDGETLRIVRRRDETVVETRQGRTLRLPGQTGTRVMRSTETRTQTVTQMQTVAETETVTVTEPVTVTEVVTVTETKPPKP